MVTVTADDYPMVNGDCNSHYFHWVNDRTKLPFSMYIVILVYKRVWNNCLKIMSLDS